MFDRLKNILLSRGIQTQKNRAAADNDWRDHVSLEIGPRSALSETQAKIIALDYGMGKIPVRPGLLYCVHMRLGLDTDPGARKPQDQQIVLVNAAEVIG
jgi:hypothetical protein